MWRCAVSRPILSPVCLALHRNHSLQRPRARRDRRLCNLTLARLLRRLQQARHRENRDAGNLACEFYGADKIVCAAQQETLALASDCNRARGAIRTQFARRRGHSTETRSLFQRLRGRRFQGSRPAV